MVDILTTKTLGLQLCTIHFNIIIISLSLTDLFMASTINRIKSNYYCTQYESTVL
jgi:hypothetical protein